jgi:threonine/homoserine/homoserine lactone efflux protein
MIAMAGPPKPGEASRGPLTFWQGAMFQWVNVKGWVAIIGTITAYAAIAKFPLNIALQVVIFLLMGTASITTWTLFGSALRPFLTSPRAVRIFNIAMALLLLASLYPVFME